MGEPTTVLIGERLGKKPNGIMMPCPQKMGMVMPTACSIHLQHHHDYDHDCEFHYY